MVAIWRMRNIWTLTGSHDLAEESAEGVVCVGLDDVSECTVADGRTCQCIEQRSVWKL